MNSTIEISNDTLYYQWTCQYLQDLSELPKPDFKAGVADIVAALQDTPKSSMPSLEARNTIAALIAEYYYQVMGEMLGCQVLNGLANYIMLDYIKSVNKSKKDDNQFLTDKQAYRRSRREYVCSTDEYGLLDYFNAKYNIRVNGVFRKKKEEPDNE